MKTLRQVLRALGSALKLMLKVLFVLLLIIIPIPVLLRPVVPKPPRRNEPTQVEKKR